MHCSKVAFTGIESLLSCAVSVAAFIKQKRVTKKFFITIEFKVEQGQADVIRQPISEGYYRRGKQRKAKMNNYSFIFAKVRSRDDKKIEAIYKATLNLVKDRGLSGITMNDISKEASIATGTLYIYFKNKEELIKELFQECRQKSAQRYFADVDEAADFKQKLQTVFTNIITYKISHFEVSAFLEQSYHSPFVCITDLKKKQKALDPLFELLQEGIDQKGLKQLELDLVVSFMFGVIHEMVKNAYFTKKKLTAAMVDDLFLMFWDAVKK